MKIHTLLPITLLATGLIALPGCNSSSGSSSPTDRAADPNAAGPNLQVDPTNVPNSIEFTQQTFTATDCEVVEGCVTGTGTRNLMLFEGDIMNTGTGDLVLGNPATSPYFSFSACHQHYHLKDIMLYELVQPQTGQVVTSGSGSVVARKQGFCMEDETQINPSAGPAKYDCTNQGISAGWEDIYDNSLSCQWLDITGVAPGNYILRLTVNPDGLYPTTNPTDNVANIPVTIPTQ